MSLSGILRLFGVLVLMTRFDFEKKQISRKLNRHASTSPPHVFEGQGFHGIASTIYHGVFVSEYSLKHKEIYPRLSGDGLCMKTSSMQLTNTEQPVLFFLI